MASRKFRSAELTEKVKDASWLEKVLLDIKEVFSEPEQLLLQTIFSQNHAEETLNLENKSLLPLNQELNMKRILERGIDNYVTMNSFNRNRVLYKGWWQPDRVSMSWLLRFGPGTEGPPGGAHGGALAAVMDQFVGWKLFPVTFCVTGRLDVKYTSFVKLEEVVLATATIIQQERRKVQVRVEIRGLPTLTSDPTELKEAAARGATVRALKTPVSGHTHYYTGSLRTSCDALMILNPKLASGEPHKEKQGLWYLGIDSLPEHTFYKDFSLERNWQLTTAKL